MNRYQKEVQKRILLNEEDLIKELEEIYEQSIRDIDAKILELLARKDTENLQSIIYQVEYQKALKTQINAILDQLHSNTFTSISQYLTLCYEEAWIGTLYDLQKQGIPLLFPINQEQVVQALLIDTKLSEGLYKALEINTTELKKEIRSEISRGISQNYSYEKIAKNIRTIPKEHYNKSIRIARTEGHRITQESTYNVQVKAKEKGAKIMKQWDATLDSRTRTTHQYLDGKTIDVDDYFESESGAKAKYPGAFGVASEDINCRCCLLQRAKWMLTDDEFTKMNGDTNELMDFKSVEDYNKFKEEFWKWRGNNK